MGPLLSLAFLVFILVLSFLFETLVAHARMGIESKVLVISLKRIFIATVKLYYDDKTLLVMDKQGRFYYKKASKLIILP